MFTVISKLISIAKKGIKYEYSSVQFNLPQSDSKSVIDFGKKYITDDNVYHKDDENDKYGRENEIHCTVLYGIKTPKITDIKEILKDVKPFKITLGDISCFKNDEKEYDVMKIDVNSKELHNINKLLKKNLEVDSDYPDYKPHITISYVKKNTVCNKLVNKDFFKGKIITISELIFSSSNGKKEAIRLL